MFTIAVLVAPLQTRKARSLAVRKLAAQTAVTASKKSGRPVDPRVQKLADSLKSLSPLHCQLVMVP